MKVTLRNFILIPLSFFLFIGMEHQANSQDLILKPDSLLMDVNYLEELMTSVHPGVYRYNSEEEVQQLFHSLRNRIKNRTLTEKEWMISLAQAVNNVKCGHTYLNPWNMKRSIRERLFGGAIYFPLGFQLIDEQLVVTENLSDEPSIRRGDVIKSINQIPSEQLLDSLKTIAKVDGDNRSPISDYLSLDEFGVTRWEAFDLYFHLFFGVDETFQVQVAHGTETKNYTFPALTKKDRMDRYKGKPLGRWDLTFDDTKAIMKLGTFATWNWKDFDHKAWFAESFQSIKDKNIETLIVDIRGNGGGLAEPRDELVKYLIKKELPCKNDNKVLIRTTKIDPSLIPFIDTWNKAILEGVPAAYYTKFEKDWYALKESLDCTTLYPKDLAFDGA
ncbi:MAG: S41 family peptidase, partial [Bacteroidota bacterium]